MMIRSAAKRPVVLPFRFLDGKVVDAGEPPTHEAVVAKLPVLIPIGSKPIPQIIVPLVGKTHRDTGSVERPQFLDQAVLQLLLPFAS